MPRHRGYATEGHDLDYSPDQLEFLRAVERYRREHCRPFPTLIEVLRVAESLGYRRVEAARELPRGPGR